MAEPLLILLSGLVVLFGLFVIGSRNPISSAFSLIALMLCLAAIYAAIGAHFVAALQVIVYAGAIMMLFVFSIMLLNMDDEKREIDPRSARAHLAVWSILILFGLMAYAFISGADLSTPPVPGPWTLDYVKQSGGNVVALSGLLFSQYYIQFEVISLLLLVAMAGALVLAKRKVD